jgi:chromosome segregation ATPase
MRISDYELEKINSTIREATAALITAKNLIDQRDEKIQSLEKQIEFLQQQNLKLIERLGIDRPKLFTP